MRTAFKQLQKIPYWRFTCISGLVIITTLLLGFNTQASQDDERFHSSTEYAYFTTLLDSLPRGYNGLFAGSGECLQCHGYDTAGVASVDLFGNDINLVDDWRATMMANSAKDPFWRAKVSHEVLVNPQYQSLIESKCTSCHAPLGHFAAFHQGADAYSIAEMANDSIALDGVSCLACHQQSEVGLGDTHSGEMHFDTEKVAYGPFPSPLSSPMLNASDYEPVFSPHISDAGICAGCHTLITETVDLEGQLTGGTFVEQATYHEWLNSDYEREDISCQSCHMPTLSKGLFYLAAGFETEPRNKFSLHELAGANVSMLKLMKERREELNISATEQDFDNVIAATENMLRFRTLEVELEEISRDADTTFLQLSLTNLAGHKFPSGYPARRAYVHLLMTTVEGDTLFESGAIDNNYELIGHDPSYEPHHLTIRTEDQVQIYEQVLGDVNNDKTTVLVRAASALKDNRLPPKGFRQDHEVYDTTLISGAALLDEDFNVDASGEGAGSDIVYYNIPMNGYALAVNVTATIYYQSMPPKWMEEMFSETSPEIDRFVEMYNAADRTPALVGDDDIMVAGIVSTNTPQAELEAKVYMAGNGELRVEAPAEVDLVIYNYSGQKLQQTRLQAGQHNVPLSFRRQMAVVHLYSADGQFTRTIWVP